MILHKSDRYKVSHIHGTHVTANIGCLNIHGTHVTDNNSSKNNVAFFFVLDLKIVYYNNY